MQSCKQYEILTVAHGHACKRAAVYGTGFGRLWQQRSMLAVQEQHYITALATCDPLLSHTA